MNPCLCIFEKKNLWKLYENIEERWNVFPIKNSRKLKFESILVTITDSLSELHYTGTNQGMSMSILYAAYTIKYMDVKLVTNSSCQSLLQALKWIWFYAILRIKITFFHLL